MRKIIPLLLTLLLLTTALTTTYTANTIQKPTQTPHYPDILSERKNIEDIILVSNHHPYYSLIGSALACWYTQPNTTGLKPLLIHNQGILPANQHRFLNQYLQNNNTTLLTLGSNITTNHPTTTLLGNPATVSIQAANHTFTSSTHILILPADIKFYTLNLYATLLASYLNIPLIFSKDNSNEIQFLTQKLNTTTAIIISNQTISLPGINQIILPNQLDIQHYLLNTIKNTFGTLKYLTITNPIDITNPLILSQNQTKQTSSVQTRQLIILGETITLQGQNTHRINISIPSGYQQIDITTTCQPYNTLWSHLFKDQPLIFLKLYDPHNQLVAYSSSLAEKPRSASLQTLACNLPGNYTLQYQLYHGFKGGYFSQRGLSHVAADIDITTNITTYAKPYLPPAKNLSQLAPYITAAHGGILIANNSFTLADETYSDHANGTAAGPWYTQSLQNYSNSKVHTILTHLNTTLDLLDQYSLLQPYLNGPAWVALLGDTTTIPMYYYQPSQPGIPEKGLASDNPYTLNNSLSTGRILSTDIYDTSILIARTLFYEQICEQPNNTETWHQRFSFIFGEGFGETGGLFHQIPYAQKLQDYGFDARVYGDLRNSRQLTTLFNTYTGANYIEYLGHGDWFWYTPSLYGLDFYGKAIDVAHARKWIFEKPSLFLSSACLMGRIDGVPLKTTISMAFLHAGCNAFIGGTRETGSEAGLEPLEDKLIIEDYSIGEALRYEKQTDQEPPTYYVRVLFGDPAFNPYEPLNGFSDQGRPDLI
jgi:hypothetical protein